MSKKGHFISIHSIFPHKKKIRPQSSTLLHEFMLVITISLNVCSNAKLEFNWVLKRSHPPEFFFNRTHRQSVAGSHAIPIMPSLFHFESQWQTMRTELTQISYSVALIRRPHIINFI